MIKIRIDEHANNFSNDVIFKLSNIKLNLFNNLIFNLFMTNNSKVNNLAKDN